MRDIFEELDTDIIIAGEDPLYNAIKELEDLGEREIARYWIYLVYEQEQKELEAFEEKS